MELAGPGRQVAESATGIAEAMTEAGGALGGLPVVGEEARTPFDKASGAAGGLAAAGEAEVPVARLLSLRVASS